MMLTKGLLQATAVSVPVGIKWSSSPTNCRVNPQFPGGILSKPPWHTNLGMKRCKRHTSIYSGPPLSHVQAMAGPFEETCHVGDHFLDNFCNFIFHQIRKPFLKYVPSDWDPLAFLPLDIRSDLQMSEAIATLVVRELLVFSAFYLTYKAVNRVCKWLYGMTTHTARAGMEIDVAAYENSPFQAALDPIRTLIMIWASSRLVQVTAVVWKMQALITPLVIYKTRAVSVICTITWFFFRWKQIYINDIVNNRPNDTPRIMAVDKIVSLAMYGLAASCAAEVMGFALRSLLAVGGVSGLAVGLAAKEVVGNMFGGAALFINRPFVIGEKIKTGTVSGHVQDIGFMQTKVQSFDGVPVLVPNQSFTNQKVAALVSLVSYLLGASGTRHSHHGVITNFSRAKTKVLEASFQLNNRHIFLVNGITDEITKYLQSLSSVETQKSAPICYLKSMQKDGPELALSCVVKSTGGVVYYKIQQEILVHVAQIITDALGSDSPFTPAHS